MAAYYTQSALAVVYVSFIKIDNLENNKKKLYSVYIDAKDAIIIMGQNDNK